MKKKLSLLLNRFLLCIFFATTLASCCPKFCMPCFKSCRRPPVIVSQESCVIDYGACLEDPCKANESVSSNDIDNEKPDVTKNPYKLVKGDVVQVNIYDDEDATMREVTVAPDGYLYFAHLNGIYAEGRTLEAVRNEMAKELVHLYVDPNLTLNLVLASDYSFTILGRVYRPGVYPLTDSLKLREAIGVAGGLLREYYNDKSTNSQLYDLVDLENSFIIRDEKKVKPNFEKLLLSCDDSHNMYIKAGDYIYLAPKKAEAVYVCGAAVAPYRVPYSRDLTVSEAISEGRGWVLLDFENRAADLGKVLVIRGSLDCPKTVVVDIRKILAGKARDFYLMPGDIVFLQNKEMRFGHELVRIAIRTFFDSFGLSAGGFWGFKWFPNG